MKIVCIICRGRTLKFEGGLHLCAQYKDSPRPPGHLSIEEVLEAVREQEILKKKRKVEER